MTNTAPRTADEHHAAVIRAQDQGHVALAEAMADAAWWLSRNSNATSMRCLFHIVALGDVNAMLALLDGAC